MAIIVLAASRQFKKLTQNPLEGRSKASPAIANDEIFNRFPN